MNMNKSFTKKDIKAKVLTDWNHFNCKFLPDELVKVKNNIAPRESKRLQSFAGQVGKVFAATTQDGKRMRNGTSRQSTRYYVEFSNGEVGGFDSMNLTLI